MLEGQCGSSIHNATFVNQSAGEVTVVGTFKSGASETFKVPAGGQTVVTREVDHGDWVGTDPLLSTVVTLANGTSVTFNDKSNGGVELRQYTIGADHNITRDR